MSQFKREFAEEQLTEFFFYNRMYTELGRSSVIRELRRCYAIIEKAEKLFKRTELCTDEECDSVGCVEYKKFIADLENL